jgi:protein-L-isoaspartate(D-aspartate) O-methyltransferase
MSDTSVQRLNMVESQVRPSDVVDRRIIRAMSEVARETFTVPAFADLAYMDEALPVNEAHGAARRKILPARTFAKMVQALDLEADARVLDVGCATGYSTAILARLAKHVVGLDTDPALVARARELLRGVSNVEFVAGDLTGGWAQGAPYDALLVNGALEVMPEALLRQLKPKGVAVAILGAGAAGRATVWTRNGDVFSARDLFNAGAAVLPGFAAPARFVF